MGMFSRLPIALACLIAAAAAAAAPARAQSGGAPTTNTIDLAGELQVDAPPGWRRGDQQLATSAFFNRMGRVVSDAVHPSGSRMSDLPYGVVDISAHYKGVPPISMQDDWAEKLAEGYATAIAPPSKADRSPAWRRAKVTSIRHDYVNSRFEFDATITYDLVGDVHVRVAGVFNAKDFAVLTLWDDDAYDAQHAGELAAMQRSFRFGSAAAPPLSMGQVFLSRTRWVMGFVILAVVGLQVYVLVRERRERRAAGVMP